MDEVEFLLAAVVDNIIVVMVVGRVMMVVVINCKEWRQLNVRRIKVKERGSEKKFDT